MAHNLLKAAPTDTTFSKFWAQCILIFGLKKAVKTTVSTSEVKYYPDKADQPVKSANHIQRNKKEKIKAQNEMTEQ